MIYLDNCGRPKTATISSTIGHNNGRECIDGDESSWCIRPLEDYPFLVLEYDNPVTVSEVTVYNKNRLKNLHVIVTDQYPEVGKMAEGMSDLSIVFVRAL